ncbi:hypothetical protein GCM10009737_18200 [Nocardioides lentus]|uniref:Glycosyl transferase family 28 C-terminal domain-containing protein n=1 Tax=Nocardioides lentus TaxID=338077 RepID=A0ABN2PB56_9ACTN
MSAALGPVLFCVGTDHHRFDRLVGWADDWFAEAAGAAGVSKVVVQHGTSRAPVVAEGHPHLAYADLQRLLAEASAVVCHGGPGLISDARGAGHVPVCVPRDPALGEHVDSHQMRFADAAGHAGVVRLARHPETMADALSATLAEARDGTRPDLGSAGLVASRAAVHRRLAEELDGLMGRQPRRRTSVIRSLRRHLGDR